MNPVSVIAGGVGALLIYCAIKDLDPRTVITGALSGQSPGKKGKVDKKLASALDPAANATGAQPTDLPGYYEDLSGL